MKAPEWQQRVLLIAGPDSVESLVRPAFGSESEFVVREGFESSVQALEQGAFHVLIIDEKGVAELNQIFELAQYATQLYQRLTIIILVNKLTLGQDEFLRKCGASLIMDRKALSLERMKYMIRVMRKRTFRTIIGTDLVEGRDYPVTLDCYLPLNNHYAPFLRSGDAMTAAHKQRLLKTGSLHLYAPEADFPAVLTALGQASRTARLASIRERFRHLLVLIFDASSDGRPQIGKQIYDEGMELIRCIEKLVSEFATPYECLDTLPFPRWSALAQGINSAIYALVFARACAMEPALELALAALFHNLGLCEVDQSVLDAKEKDLTPAQRASYRKHPEIAVAILRGKRMPFSPAIETAILYHHENYDGSGFPEGLSLDKIPLEAGLLAIVGSFDHLHSLKPGAHFISPARAWELLMQHHRASSAGFGVFCPSLLAKIEPVFTSAVATK